MDFDFVVEGVSYSNRDQLAAGEILVGDPVELERAASGQITVRHANGVLGSVPESDALTLAPRIEAGASVRAEVKKVLGDEVRPRAVIWGSIAVDDPAELARRRADEFAARVAALPPHQPRSALGWIAFVGKAALITLALFALALFGTLYLITR